MADTVQYFVERMIPELEELQTSGIFSKEEVKMIAKRRTDFEYAVKRKGKERVDFIKYIEYELDLDLLRKKRVERLGIKQPGKFEHAATSRICYLFQRAINKFKSDTRLWLQYIDYCMRSGSNRRLAQVFADVLKVHPLNPSFWILAASWEFEVNHNIMAARALMQRAIRLMPNETKLYVEFCRLELMYREKIKQRMELFGLDKAALNPNTEQEINREDLPTNPDDPETGDVIPSTDNEPQNTENPADKSNNPFFEGAIASVIFKAAIKVAPNDLSLRRKILEVYQLFTETESLQEEVYQSLEQDFPDSEEAAAMLAARPITSLFNAKTPNQQIDHEEWFNAVREVTDNFDNAALRLPTARMFEIYISFLIEQMSSKYADDEHTKSFFAKRLNMVVKNAFAQRVTTPKSLQMWLEHLMEYDQLDRALSESQKCIETHPSSATLWIIHLSLLASTQSSRDKLMAQLEKGVQSVSIEDNLAWKVWALLLFHYIDASVDTSKVMSSYFNGLKRLSGSNLENLKLDFLRLIKSKWPAETVRTVYNKTFDRPPNTVEYYTACIDFEKSQLQPQEHIIRQLFEYAVRDHGETNADVWLRFIEWEISLSNHANAGRLYWRAKKTLKVPDDFVARHTELVNSQS